MPSHPLNLLDSGLITKVINIETILRKFISSILQVYILNVFLVPVLVLGLRSVRTYYLLNYKILYVELTIASFPGWYDRKVIGAFKNLVDINFLVALGPPGGGRNPLTTRVIRHFNLLTFCNLQDESKERIFDTILSNHLSSMPGGGAEFSNLVTKATITVRYLSTRSGFVGDQDMIFKYLTKHTMRT